MFSYSFCNLDVHCTHLSPCSDHGGLPFPQLLWRWLDKWVSSLHLSKEKSFFKYSWSQLAILLWNAFIGMNIFQLVNKTIWYICSILYINIYSFVKIIYLISLSTSFPFIQLKDRWTDNRKKIIHTKKRRKENKYKKITNQLILNPLPPPFSLATMLNPLKLYFTEWTPMLKKLGCLVHWEPSWGACS